MIISAIFLRFILISIFVAAIVLGVRVLSFGAKNRLNLVSAGSLFVAAVLAIIEYEFTHIADPALVTKYAVLHTSSATVLVMVAAWAAKLFADDSHIIPRWVWDLLLATLGGGSLLLLYGLLFTPFNPDVDLYLANPGFWKHRLDLSGFFGNVYNIFFLYAVSFMSFCYFISYMKAEKKREKRWKLWLFLTYSILPFGMLYLFIFRVNEEISGDYLISPFLAGCVFVLGWIYSNFKLFEISPSSAVHHILDSMSNLTLIVDEEFKIKFVNDAVCKRFDLTPAALINFPLRLALERIRLNDYLEHIDSASKLGKGHRNEIEFSIWWNGEKQDYLAVITPVYNAQALRTGYVIVATDLTRLKRSEVQLREHAEELEKSNQELERFAYIASHDLKSPLRNITSFANLLERRLGTQMSQEVKDYLQFIVTNAKYMYTLVQDVLEFSLLKKEAATKEEVKLGEVVEIVLQNLTPLINSKKAKVHCSDLPILQSNFSLMRQLFQNLIENGLKYNGNAHPTIWVNWKKGDQSIIFSVKDNGIGIENAYQQQIFTMFKRLHSQSSYEGTGIGLAICKKIVELHGGSIWLESEVEEGTTFFFSIPHTESMPEL